MDFVGSPSADIEGYPGKLMLRDIVRFAFSSLLGQITIWAKNSWHI